MRDCQRVFELFETNPFDLIIHCAAQPSHGKACQIPLLDFEVNALGTVNFLEATRQFCPEAVFIHISTNKVYGEAPNEVPRVELEKRYDYANKVFGYKGKPVWDNIHSFDVIQSFEAFRRNPRPGEVYNLGGGRENSVSILEAFDIVENLTGKKVNWTYVDQNQICAHICYISDLSKLKAEFPEWGITQSLTDILKKIVAAEQERYAKL